MWIIETKVNGATYWLQVAKHRVRLNGLKDNAACYPLHSQAIDALSIYKSEFNTELQIVHKETGRKYEVIK